MAVLKYNNVGISAMAASVTKQKQSNLDLIPYFGEKEIYNIITSIDIKVPSRASKTVTRAL